MALTETENNVLDSNGERVIVSLPFIAAARAASAPALGRFGRLYGSSPSMQEVYRMIESGELPSTRVSETAIRIPKRELAAWLRERTTAARRLAS